MICTITIAIARVAILPMKWSTTIHGSGPLMPILTLHPKGPATPITHTRPGTRSPGSCFWILSSLGKTRTPQRCPKHHRHGSGWVPTSIRRSKPSWPRFRRRETSLHRPHHSPCCGPSIPRPRHTGNIRLPSSAPWQTTGLLSQVALAVNTPSDARM